MDGPNSSLREQTALLVFLNHCFNSMEVELIRDQVKRLVSLSMWVSLQQVNLFVS
jgi:intron-binding protein aquarius